MNSETLTIDLLKHNDIKNVLFDMDSTLVDTDPYFEKNMKSVIEKIIYIDTNTNDVVINYVFSLAKEIFKEVGKPMLVDQLVNQAITKYYDENNIQYDSTILKTEIEKLFENFYTVSPEVFPSTLELLKKLKDNDIKIGVYSHAQYEWTGIKIRKIKEKYIQKYMEEIDIPYTTTDISQSKDADGWGEAGKRLNFNISETLVIGDSWSSDILPAISAGYRFLVHLYKGKEIKTVDSKSSIFYTSDLQTLVSKF